MSVNFYKHVSRELSLEHSLTNVDGIYFPSDSDCIILEGKEYGNNTLVNKINDSIGDLKDLRTKNIDTLVNAINEVCDLANGYTAKEYAKIYITSEDPDFNIEGITIWCHRDDTSEIMEATTNEIGYVLFEIPNGTVYTIKYPDIAGYKDIPDQKFLAMSYINQLAISYEPVNDSKEENVIVKVWQNIASVYQPYKNQNVYVKIGSNPETVFSSGETGTIEFKVNIGTTYSVRMEHQPTYYIYGKSQYSYTAERSNNIITFTYLFLQNGLFIVDKDAKEYTYEEWYSKLEGKTEEEKEEINESAVFFKLATANLLNHNGVFYIKIDDIVNKSYATTRYWCNVNQQFSNMTLNGNNVNDLYFYDGFSSTRLMLEYISSNSLSSTAATYCNSLSYSFAEGEQGLRLQGFLWSLGQDRELYYNVGALNELLKLVRPNATNDFTTLINTNKWTSTQYSATHAYSCNASVYNYYKYTNYAVLVSYAIPHVETEVTTVS